MNHKIVLLIGDPFLCEENYRSICRKITSQVSGEIAYAGFRASEDSLPEILEKALGLPFWVEGQVLRVRESERYTEPEALAAYLALPNPPSWIIFEAESLREDHALLKLLRGKSEIIRFDKKDKRSSAETFIRDKLKRAGKTMHPQALARLCEWMGDHPVFLASVVDQILNYAGDVSMIDEDMVSRFEERWQDLEVFQLTDAIGNRQGAKALELLLRLQHEEEAEPVAMIGMLHWFLRRLWVASAALEKGRPQDEILKLCRVSFKQAPFFMKQVRAFTRLKLEQSIEALFYLDWEIKTGRTEPALGMEKWVIQACS